MLVKAFAVFVALMTLGSAQAQQRPVLDAAVDAAAAQGFAGQVGLTDRSGTVYRRVVSAPGRPHAVGDLWRWASVTKQITATLILQDAQAGRLPLDDSLALRLPGFDGPSAAQVTLRMLLQHTSGLPNPDDSGVGGETDLPAFYREPTTRSAALHFCAGKPRAEPGAGFAYNNCDFIVLGAVLEQISGLPYARLVEARLAKPLDLASLALAAGQGDPPMVRGWLDATRPEPRFHLESFGASGALYGDPADLLALDRALLKGDLLDASSTTLAWTGEPKLGYVALGVWAFSTSLKGCAETVKLVERRGEIGGVEVRNLIAPEIGRALVVFSDRSDLDFGEIWQGQGLTFGLASAAFCS